MEKQNGLENPLSISEFDFMLHARVNHHALHYAGPSQVTRKEGRKRKGLYHCWVHPLLTHKATGDIIQYLYKIERNVMPCF